MWGAARTRTLLNTVGTSHLCQDEAFTAGLNGLVPRQLGPAAAVIRNARSLGDERLFDRHRLTDDDAHRRSGWNDLGQFESAAR